MYRNVTVGTGSTFQNDQDVHTTDTNKNNMFITKRWASTHHYSVNYLRPNGTAEIDGKTTSTWLGFS